MDKTLLRSRCYDFIRAVALARIMMPKAFVRLSGGRREMSELVQAFCFYAGANSIHYGEELLTSPNFTPEDDEKMLEKLGMQGI